MISFLVKSNEFAISRTGEANLRCEVIVEFQLFVNVFSVLLPWIILALFLPLQTASESIKFIWSLEDFSRNLIVPS